LSVVRGLLSVVRGLLSVVCGPWSVVRGLWSVVSSALASWATLQRGRARSGAEFGF